jgi:hypothetical protein
LSATHSRALGDDEWGHIILLKYIAGRQVGNAHALAELRNEFNPAAKRDLVEAPWFRVAAEYFVNPQSDPTELQSFLDDNAHFDPKNKPAFNCLLHFYTGMRLLWDGSPTAAKKELELSIGTEQRQYVEYWIARREHDLIP